MWIRKSIEWFIHLCECCSKLTWDKYNFQCNFLNRLLEDGKIVNMEKKNKIVQKEKKDNKNCIDHYKYQEKQRGKISFYY